MRILMVEDETNIGQFIQQGLKEAGYAIDWVKDGQLGLDYALSINYDAIVLDMMLPGLDGFSFLRELRRRRILTPVLCLTALDTVGDRVRGLDVGADDYLVKPFAYPELLARLRALLRRPPLQTQTILRIADLELDLTTRKVQRAGRSIPLSAREFSLLEFLMRHPNQVLSRTQIGEHIWNIDFDSESNVIDVYIGYLRRKIDK
ncbi:MAG TPA: response regulator transcription factor, partial [Anaerolineae bacterium]|nr:response regulator transcription factor [Anaerolineae bacterium]